MNPKWKLGVLFLLLTVALLWPSSAKLNGAAQESEPDYKNNNCVSCHSRLLEPLRVGKRSLEWRFSRHRDKGVSCEKCHGGDPSAMDERQAHAGVSPASDQTEQTALEEST